MSRSRENLGEPERSRFTLVMWLRSLLFLILYTQKVFGETCYTVPGRKSKQKGLIIILRSGNSGRSHETILQICLTMRSRKDCDAMDCERAMGISKKALSTAMLTSQSVQLCKLSLAPRWKLRV
ncbi:hypothetical protein IGI04_035603 [Brassica rapa subsp. trilocularis]|uniref:Secreted protein n=1 Tax=Brassica rapa subsp. trilocularis TaxID=1813537 RepID=A0ABQ7LF71_BRACM|nr:hypothetical protein IGI04_035603 [Brassica rapa subsp. trilocularis]